MKLTHDIRREFVDAVMATIKVDVGISPAQAIEEYENRAIAALPRKVAAVRKEYPGSIAMMRVTLREADMTAPGAYRYWYATIPRVIDDKSIPFDDLYEQVLVRDRRQAELDKYRDDLLAAAMSVTTDKALIELLPDLTSYVPSPPPKSYPLVPVAKMNALVDNLKAAGLKIPKAKP